MTPNTRARSSCTSTTPTPMTATTRAEACRATVSCVSSRRSPSDPSSWNRSLARDPTRSMMSPTIFITSQVTAAMHATNAAGSSRPETALGRLSQAFMPSQTANAAIETVSGQS